MGNLRARGNGAVPRKRPHSISESLCGAGIRADGKTPAYAWTLHIPSNYASNPRSPLGKVRMESLFAGAAEAVAIDRWGVKEHDEPPHLASIELELDAMPEGPRRNRTIYSIWSPTTTRSSTSI